MLLVQQDRNGEALDAARILLSRTIAQNHYDPGAKMVQEAWLRG